MGYVESQKLKSLPIMKPKKLSHFLLGLFWPSSTHIVKSHLTTKRDTHMAFSPSLRGSLYCISCTSREVNTNWGWLWLCTLPYLLPATLIAPTVLSSYYLIANGLRPPPCGGKPGVAFYILTAEAGTVWPKTDKYKLKELELLGGMYAFYWICQIFL